MKSKLDVSKLKPWSVPVGVFLASRVVVWFSILGAAYVSRINKVSETITSWDGDFYLDIVRRGYHNAAQIGSPFPQQKTHVYFPLFPMTVRLFNKIFGISSIHGTLTSIVIWSTVLGLVAVLAIWWTTRDIWGENVAFATALLVSIFPGAYVFSMAYSESMFFIWAALALWSLHKQHWYRAGIVIAFATATRFNALSLVAAAGVVSAVAIYKKRDFRSLFAPIFGCTGVIAYFIYIKHLTGSFFDYFAVEKKGWGQKFDLLILPHTLKDFILHPSHAAGSPNGFVPVVGTFVLAALLYGLWRAKLPLTYVAYTLLAIPEFLFSADHLPNARFILSAFPLLIGAAIVLKERQLLVVSVVFAGCLGMLTLFTLQGTFVTP